MVKTWAIQKDPSDTARKYRAGARVELVNAGLVAFIPALRNRILDYASESRSNRRAER